MGIRERAAAFAVAAILALAGLSGCAPDEPDPGSRITVSVDGDLDAATVTAGTLTETSLAGLREATAAGAVIGVPTQIELDGEMPTTGVQLTRVYPEPLPEDTAAAFMFFNDELGGWQAVPSELSADRRTLTATVHHLSLWDDIVAGGEQALQSVVNGAKSAGQSVQEAAAAVGNSLEEANTNIGKACANGADALYFGIGKIFDTRVDDPVCDMPVTPLWVESVVVIGHNANNPILFCTGRDANSPDLLVVKARVNRGFAYTVTAAAPPQWSYNSTVEQAAFDAALQAVGNIDTVIAQSISDLSANGVIVGPAQEISYGFSSTAVNSVPIGSPLVTLHPPTVPQFLTSSIASALVKWGLSSTDGYLAATIAVASCTNALKDTSDVLTGAAAVLDCLGEADEEIAKKLALALLETGSSPQAAGAAAGSMVAKASLVLAVIAPATAALNFVAESVTPESARTVTVFTTGGGELVDISSWVIGYGTLGPLTAGTSIDQITEALSAEAGQTIETGRYDDFSGYRRQGALSSTGTTAHIGYLAESAGSNGPVDRFSISGPYQPSDGFTVNDLPRTAGGNTVGSMEADVRAEFGAMEERANPYVEGGKLLTTLGPGISGIVFVTDETGTVTQVVTGNVPQVYYPEGCA